MSGWDQEDHAAALLAFQRGCGVSRNLNLRAVCQQARLLRAADETQARSFFETHFQPRWVGGGGLLTAYFAPEYEARETPAGPYTAPVRERPADLVTLDLGLFDPALAGKTVAGRVNGQHFAPYDDRATIEAERSGHPIAWMRPEDLFFLQIQGSGVLVLPDGRRIRLAYSASNGRPFVGIAAILRDRGELAEDDTSGDSIRRWLSDHRGPEADEVMRQDPRYVFFKLAPDAGPEPAGAAGVALLPGRAVAVDPSLHPLGTVFWINARAPALAGARADYSRLVMAMDTGSAIKGAVRADLYIGSGPVAGLEAGRVRHILDLYELTPIAATPP